MPHCPSPTPRGHDPPFPAGAVTLDMSFIEEAVRELLQSRRVLKASYGFGYYVKGNTAKTIFESLQVRMNYRESISTLLCHLRTALLQFNRIQTHSCCAH